MKNINEEILWNYFKYQNPSVLEKDLIRATQAKNDQLVNNVHDGLINLKSAIIKNNPENKTPSKTIYTVENIVFNKKTRRQRTSFGLR